MSDALHRGLRVGLSPRRLDNWAKPLQGEGRLWGNELLGHAPGHSGADGLGRNALVNVRRATPWTPGRFVTAPFGQLGEAASGRRSFVGERASRARSWPLWRRRAWPERSCKCPTRYTVDSGSVCHRAVWTIGRSRFRAKVVCGGTSFSGTLLATLAPTGLAGTLL